MASIDIHSSSSRIAYSRNIHITTDHRCVVDEQSYFLVPEMVHMLQAWSLGMRHMEGPWLVDRQTWHSNSAFPYNTVMRQWSRATKKLPAKLKHRDVVFVFSKRSLLMGGGGLLWPQRWKLSVGGFILSRKGQLHSVPVLGYYLIHLQTRMYRQYIFHIWSPLTDWLINLSYYHGLAILLWTFGHFRSHPRYI